MAEKGEKVRRKTRVERIGPAWRSVSNSSEEESLSPLEKKAKVKLHMSDTVQSSEEDETAAALELANSAEARPCTAEVTQHGKEIGQP